MEASAFNGNVQFENYYAYNSNNNSKTINMSGFTTEQSEYNAAAMIHGKRFNNTFNGIEIIADDLADELQVSYG